MAKFRLSELKDPFKTALFDQRKVTIGRSRSNDFVVEDMAVSRQQAEITLEADGYVVRNIGRFPLRINRQPSEYRALQNGDILTIGNSSNFRFETTDAGGKLITQLPETSVAIDSEEAMRAITGKKARKNSANNSRKNEVDHYREASQEDNPDNEAAPNQFIATIALINQRFNSAGAVNNKVKAAASNTDDLVITETEHKRVTETIDLALTKAEDSALTKANDTAVTNGEETLIEPSPAILKALSGPEAGTTYLLEENPFVIGRAIDSDIVINDKRVSRKHLKIEQRASEYFLVRLTQHQTILVNSQSVSECRLLNNDLIEFFTLSFKFKSTHPADQRAADLPATLLPLNSALDETRLPDTTVLQAIPNVKNPGPRLVNHNKHGGSAVYRLSSGRSTLGRDAACDVVIEGDKSVSRLHAVIEKKAKGHFIHPESVNPVLHNRQRVKHATRIYSGDTLQLGDTLLTFLCEFKEDQSPARKWTSKIILPLTSALFIALLGLLIYEQLWQPWHIDKQIANAEQHISKAENSQGQKILEVLYTKHLDPTQRRRVVDLLSTSQLALVSHQLKQNTLEPARDMLVRFLRQYGVDQEMAESWQKLNEIRFLLAKKYQAEGSTKAALKEYVAIDGDSDLYSAAQKAISNIWFKQVSPSVAEPTDMSEVDNLLAQAELLFEKQYYLTPKHNNAYALYAQILDREPGNPVALNKVAAMKAFYQQQGNALCARGDQLLAGTYFRRYLIIEPENAAVQQALANISDCYQQPAVATSNQQTPGRQLLTGESGATTDTNTDTNTGTGTDGETNTDKAVAMLRKTSADSKTADAVNSHNKQKIENLLKQEGVESTWIIEYLFDEPNSNSDQPTAETPW